MTADRRRRTLTAWVVLGGVLGGVLGVGTAWLSSGPDHYEWLDIAVVLGGAGLLLGVVVGAVTGDRRPR